jgi:hypothetical protein
MVLVGLLRRFALVRVFLLFGRGAIVGSTTAIADQE